MHEQSRDDTDFALPYNGVAIVNSKANGQSQVSIVNNFVQQFRCNFFFKRVIILKLCRTLKRHVTFCLILCQLHIIIFELIQQSIEAAKHKF